jgi:hypothetical protein
MGEGVSIEYRETKGQSRGRLNNISYGKDIRAINGALDAVVEWSGKSREELAAILLDEFVDFDDEEDDA